MNAAAILFAEHGFHGTSMRQIARRGGVNLAASHYHYGSKRDLYVEVLRAQFAAIHDELDKRGALLPNDISGWSRPQLVAMLRTRIRVMLDLMLGPPPSLHSMLMQREMNDPSEALPIIVDEMMAPMLSEVARILTALAPELEASAIERSAFSIVGQALFYRITMPALLLMKDRREYGRNFNAQMAEHIVEFSLGGLSRLETLRKKKEKG